MPHHREGTEPSHQERVLHGVRSSHTDAVLQPVVGKCARAVQDENHPPRQAREQTRSMQSTIGGSTSQPSIREPRTRRARCNDDPILRRCRPPLVTKRVTSSEVPTSNANCFLVLPRPCR